MLLLARLACSEAGTNLAETKRVLRVVYNRAQLRGTTVMQEATRPGQFYYKNCTGAREKWLQWFHLSLALETLHGKIKAETAINSHNITHFGTTKRLNQPHSRCKGYTIREVWKWYGLRKILTTEVGHEYYRKTKGTAGCPKKTGSGG
tara:strand:- start:887 stop:1330 length:444 start_codon:yes stop_codon:yes gene_type:complete